MTHSDIYTKFMIEYDKAQITSSYPSLTKYEVATLLDKAYLAIIAQKLTGNNTRQVPFEGDTKAIEDIRPLITTKRLDVVNRKNSASNEYVYNMPTNMLYYISGIIENSGPMTSIDNKQHSISSVDLIAHEDADKFKSTTYNLPWIKIPVSYIENSEIHVLIDPNAFNINQGTLDFTATYIKKPNKFVIGSGSSTTDYDFSADSIFQLSDTMAEELINTAIIFSSEIVESPRTTTKVQLKPLES